MKQIKIMRGIQGSGKSTYARMLKDAAQEDGQRTVIVSADDHFMSPSGYKFDPAKLGQAHKECMQLFLRVLQEEASLVIVDNTNINVEDVAPYVAVGEAMGYDVTIIQVNTPPEVAAGRNVHGVGESQVRSAHDRLQRIKLPSRYRVVCVEGAKHN